MNEYLMGMITVMAVQLAFLLCATRLTRRARRFDLEGLHSRAAADLIRAATFYELAIAGAIPFIGFALLTILT